MKRIFLAIICVIVVTISLILFGNSRSGNYYSSPEREVDQLSSEYYLGPIINENNEKISTIKHFEILDGVTESASPIGYYIQFEYKENNIDCEITISSFPLKEYDGDIKNSNIYLYKEYEIYLWENFDEERNLVTKSNIAILGDYVCLVEIPRISPNDNNFESFKELSLEFMFELIDNYIANNN